MRLWLAAALVLLGCGTRTALDPGQRVMDAAPPPPRDAGVDAFRPPDAGADAGTDAGRRDAGRPCIRDRATLPLGEVDLVFVIDRSASMGWTIFDSDQSRWELLELAMNDVFHDVDPRVGVGVLLFPSGSFCTLEEDLQVPVAPGSVDAVLATLEDGVIDGRSPIDFALSNAYLAFENERPHRRNRFVVLLSDGASESCMDSPIFPDISVWEAHRERGIDTFGVAVAGAIGPVVEGGGRRHYDASNLDELRAILTEIESALTGCVFEVPFEPSHPDLVTVRVGAEEVPFDRAGLDGWGWTGAEGRSISLYGSACTRRLERAAPVEAVVECDVDGGVIDP